MVIEVAEVEKKGFGKERVGLVTCGILVVILGISNVWSYTTLQNQIDALKDDTNRLQDQVDALNDDKNVLQNQIDSLNTTYQDYVATHSMTDSEYNASICAFEDEVAELKSRVEALEGKCAWQAFLVEDYGGSYEIYQNGTVRLQSLGGNSLGKPITLYQEFTPKEDFTISLKVKANQLGGFMFALRASLPFAGSTHGVNFEFGSRDGGTFLLARWTGGWTWTTFATGTESTWYTIKLVVHETPFRILGEVLESETMIGSLTISDMTNFGFNDIQYVGVGCWTPSDFLVRDFCLRACLC